MDGPYAQFKLPFSFFFLQFRAARKRLMNTKPPNMDAFLRMYPDPEATFYGTSISPLSRPSAGYVEHAKTQLLNDYPRLGKNGIKLVLETCDHHYAPTKRALDEALARQGKNLTSLLGEHFCSPIVSYYSCKFLRFTFIRSVYAAKFEEF